MTFPFKTIRIGPYDFRVAPLAEGSPNLGELDYEFHELRLRDRWADKRQAASTFLHEIMHGCWYVADIKPDTPEEDAVTRLEMVLSGVIRDNPQAMRWLVKALA